MPLTMSLSSSHRLRLGVAAGASAAFVLLAGPAAAQESEEPDYEIDDTHTIEQGGSLSAIADEYDIDDWVVLYAVNADEIADPDVVLVGQEIDIPADPDAVDVDAVELPGGAGPSESGGGAAETASTGGSAPEPAPQPAPQPAPAAESTSGSVWDRLAQCESNGRWSTNTGNGFYGGLQFHPQTWAAYGGHQYAPNAHQASRSQEIAVAERVQASQGWGAWPSCSSQLGL